MQEKLQLLKQLQQKWQDYWKIDFLIEHGFKRQKCKKCGRYFWSVVEQDYCNDAGCVGYTFLDKSYANAKLDYVETWQAIKNFFVKNGHVALLSYPVVCRWFPGLSFTLASIVAFQRKTNDATVFEFPANPLIIPQFCLRFNDIDKVGLTGRHATSFVMIGQHSLYDGKQGYWKENAVELDYRMLTEVFKIKPEHITFKEDAWLGAGAFGYSLEYFVGGLELGNCVFTEFLGTPEQFTVMKQKVIDMGAGLGRFTWLMQRTLTQYDVVYANTLKLLKKLVNYDEHSQIYTSFLKKLSSIELDTVNFSDALKKIGISTSEYKQHILPLQAIYSIADHLRSLILAIDDYALPNNTGGGYNLRVLFRRIFNFMHALNIEIDLHKLVELELKLIAKFKQINEGTLDRFIELFEIEQKKFNETRNKLANLIVKVIEKKKAENSAVITGNELLELYQSKGIQPELLREYALKNNIQLNTTEFYELLETIKKKKIQAKQEWQEWLEHINKHIKLEPTQILFYEKPMIKQFKASIVAINHKLNAVVLDKTAFYAESGGQIADTGIISNGKTTAKVIDVKKYNNVIVHFVNSTEGLTQHDEVNCSIDADRRLSIMKHHTSVHIINYACRQVLGNHVWQTGSAVSDEKASLDITHYKQISDDQRQQIEAIANKVINDAIDVTTEILPRPTAEKQYGFRIYQGGAIPVEELRIVKIDNLDIEACGGTHLSNTSEAGMIKIVSIDKIADNTYRLVFVAGEKAKQVSNAIASLLEQASALLGVTKQQLPNAIDLLFKKWKKLRKLRKAKKQPSEQDTELLKKQFNSVEAIDATDDILLKQACSVIRTQPEHLIKTINRFLNELEEMQQID